MPALTLGHRLHARFAAVLSLTSGGNGWRFRVSTGRLTVSFRRTFLADLRRQAARATESPPVWLVRFNAAGLSIGFGMVGAVMFLPMARGVVSWASAPGSVLLIVGGLLGLGAQLSNDVAVSRRRGLEALLTTAVGLAALCLPLGMAS